MNDPGLLSEDETKRAEEAKERTLRLLRDALKKRRSLLVDHPKEFIDQAKYSFCPLITPYLVRWLIWELGKVTFAKDTISKKNTIAYVYPGSRDRTIYLCAPFWKDSKSRSQQNTIIHEVSHFLGYMHTVEENSDEVKKSPQSRVYPLTAYSAASTLTSDMDHAETYKNDSYPCCGETSRDTVCEKSWMGFYLRSIRELGHQWRDISQGVDEADSPGEDIDTSAFAGFTVWIVGHSFVYWAERRAVKHFHDRNLSLPPDQVKVHWMGVRGQRWEGLLEQILLMRERLPAPDIVIIHLGGNDIGKTGTIDLVFQMKKILMRIRRLFPDVRLVFSEIVPRPLRLKEMDLNLWEKVRRRINRALSMFMPSLGGFSFRHKDLEDDVDGLYRSDAMHLSERGLDIFNFDLQVMIERALGWVAPEETILSGRVIEPSDDDTESSGKDIKSCREDNESSGEDIKSCPEDNESSGEDIESLGEDNESSGEDIKSCREDNESSGEDIESLGEDNESSGEDKESRGEDKESRGEDNESSGEVKESPGEDTESSDKNRRPYGEDKELCGDKTKPSGKTSDSSFEDTDPSDEDTESSNEETESSDEDTEQTNEGTEPSNEGREPSNEGTELSDADTESSKEGTESSNEGTVI